MAHPDRLPRLAITPGDPGGVGPEIVERVRGLEEIRRVADLRVVDRSGGVRGPARPTAEAGRASIASFDEAIALALAGEVDAVVTGPVDKRSLALAGAPHAGHTAILRARLPSASPLMTMVAPGALRVVLVTDHVPLAAVAPALSTDSIARTIRSAAAGLEAEFGLSRPRLAVLGLNPHAGDAGVLGREEEDAVAPAIERARAWGVEATGPWPADGFFGSGSHGAYDAVVAMYHDQGLIPVKMLGGRRTVGVTLGLPFVRTSVGHGTAFDAVGRADPRSLVEAIRLAVELVHVRWAVGLR